MKKSGSLTHEIIMTFQKFIYFTLSSKSQESCSHWKTLIQDRVCKEI